MRESERPAELKLVDLPVAARLNAVRDGELDLALVCGAVASAAVAAVPAWSEPLHAVLGREHPAARLPVVDLEDLDPFGLRLPAREVDPPMHDAILAALPLAPPRPPAGDVLNVLFEVGRDPQGWTLMPAEQLTGFRTERLLQASRRSWSTGTSSHHVPPRGRAWRHTWPLSRIDRPPLVPLW